METFTLAVLTLPKQSFSRMLRRAQSQSRARQSRPFLCNAGQVTESRDLELQRQRQVRSGRLISNDSLVHEGDRHIGRPFVVAHYGQRLAAPNERPEEEPLALPARALIKLKMFPWDAR